MLKPGTLGLVLLLGVGGVAGAWADDAPEIVFYRYVDSRGQMVLDRQGVPPEYSSKGYEVLNQRGRVIQVVPPALSSEQLIKAQAAAQSAKVQADADARLLRLYGSLTDIDRAKARKLAELDALISTAQGNIQALAAQQAALQSQAADHERAGRQVPQGLIDQISDVQDQQANLKADILRYQSVRQQTDKDFAQDRARLQVLLTP